MQEAHKRPQKAQRVAHTNGCHLPIGVLWGLYTIFLSKIMVELNMWNMSLCSYDNNWETSTNCILTVSYCLSFNK